MNAIRSLPYKWMVAIVFVIGLFMDLLDTTIVNVALPAIGQDLSEARNTTLEWVITAYLISLAVWIPASGWLGDRIGTKRVFIFALIAFTAGSALCGEAQSIGQLITFRVIQGVGGGMLTPVGTAMIFRAFPQEERASASAVITVPVAIAPTIGPIIGGLLVDHASWRWIFRVNVPIGLIGLVLAVTLLQEHREEDAGSFDLVGFLLGGAGLPLVLYALSSAPDAGWTSARVLGTGLAGIALLVALVISSRIVREPILDFGLFRDRMFRNSNIVGFMINGGMLGLLFLLPLFLQQLRGLSATESGFTTFAQALGVIATAPIASKLYPLIGPRRLLFSGMLILSVFTLVFFWVDLDTSLWWIRGALFVRGIGFGLTIVPVQAATFAQISSEDSGRASAIFNTNRQVAGSLGVAILATVLSDRSATHVARLMKSATDQASAQLATLHGNLDGFHDAFLAATALSILGLAFTLLIHDEDALPKEDAESPAAEQSQSRSTVPIH